MLKMVSLNLLRLNEGNATAAHAHQIVGTNCSIAPQVHDSQVSKFSKLYQQLRQINFYHLKFMVSLFVCNQFSGSDCDDILVIQSMALVVFISNSNQFPHNNFHVKKGFRLKRQ